MNGSTLSLPVFSFRRACALTVLSLSLALPAQAQSTTSVSLSDAVKASLQNGADVRTAQANLDKAQASLKATLADPSALVADTLQAQQAAALASVQLQNAKLSTLQNVISAYTTLYTAQENVSTQNLQVQSDTKNLQVVQVKLNLKNATALDVKNAQSSLGSSTQNLSDAKAQVNIAAQKLAALTGLSSSLKAAGMGSIPSLKTSQTALTAGLNSRLPSVVQAQQSVDLAQLNVKLYDNDFTPAQTLNDAKVTLANAQRSLDSATKNAATTLSSAYQSAANAQQLLAVAFEKEANAGASYSQDQTRLKSGVISAVDLLKSQLALAQAQQNRVQAQSSALSSLASVSAASGTNLTGVGGL